jgi:DNA replication protein DnaC
VMTTLTGTCTCGTEVSREEADGFGARILNNLPLRCSTCSARDAKDSEVRERLEQGEHDQRRYAGKLQVLPTALRGHRLNTLDTDGRTDVLDAAQRWVAGELNGLVLLGPFGVGKTTVAAACVADYIGRHLHGPTPRWINATLALSNLSRSFRDSEREVTIEALTGARAPLVLDDIDKCKPNVFAAEQLFLAIDLCLTHERSLIVTTNLLPSQLAARWPKPHGEAIASRLAGYCELHQVIGEDRRLRTAA